jgi:hypothetical protein
MVFYPMPILFDISNPDPRDKIYALMGLMANKDDLLIPVDYTKSYTEVFFEFAKRSIVKYQTLLPIAIAGTNANSESSRSPP